MFPKLFKSKRFVEDLKLWTSKIDTIADPVVKTKGQSLLEEFTNHARQIDAGHDIGYTGNIKPDRLRESVSSLQTIRLRIEKFVSDIDR